MKNLCNSLPFRLLLGIAVGIICGLVFPESVMKVVVTLQYIMGQLITFCVPLIISWGPTLPGCWGSQWPLPMSLPSARRSCPLQQAIP